MEGEVMKARSFRYEGYNTGRVFLRSYPLQWGSEAETEENDEAAATNRKQEAAKVANSMHGKKPIKKIILAVFHWGDERVMVFRRFKHKTAVYVFNCVPGTLRATNVLISVK